MLAPSEDRCSAKIRHESPAGPVWSGFSYFPHSRFSATVNRDKSEKRLTHSLRPHETDPRTHYKYVPMYLVLRGERKPTVDHSAFVANDDKSRFRGGREVFAVNHSCGLVNPAGEGLAPTNTNRDGLVRFANRDPNK
jgi:hypothetical protein